MDEWMSTQHWQNDTDRRNKNYLEEKPVPAPPKSHTDRPGIEIAPSQYEAGYVTAPK